MICGAQTTSLKGKVIASSELGSIHVLNISAQKNTITDEQGAFEISAKQNDTILISSIQYTPQSIVVSKANIEMKFITITLSDRVNELDEVVVGKVLTGNLLSDIENSDAKRDINFYDVGIPGYTGKQKTQKERRLYEADAGKSIIIAPLFVGINIHKILNKISGRTKKLKRIVLLEQHENCIKSLSAEFSDILFDGYDIESGLKIDFFYYVVEDPKTLELCAAKNSLKTYEFLLKKLYEYEDTGSVSED
ncbi:carboxypeptidase-like regulatory domain-containing protein [Psychroserpens algicola]|uniref:Carboxypeptidase-like regulatory domain-containing protein n=1 Tax=Psychroserpens algicola TaxID=1719034 RepID=A0ABT0HA85_9FLAO|nr:carboxypeptidase-like regulatory domain-containing protein [Psychroserpens algicola]MCK8481256.1 carboxypeptidase-like regulatory domain-containing protein [Psychroserpens algicola]